MSLSPIVLAPRLFHPRVSFHPSSYSLPVHVSLVQFLSFVFPFFHLPLYLPLSYALSLPGSHTNTAQCLPGHTPFSMLIVPPDSFCSREKKRLLPSSPLPPSLKFTNSGPSSPPRPPSPFYSPPPTFTIGPHSRWSTHTHSTGVKVKGCSCLNKEMGGGRKGERWRGRRVTHSLASLSAVGRGSSSLGCGGYFDGLVRVWGRGAMARCFGLSYTVWNSSCCTSFSHSVYSLWLQQM